MTSTVIRFRSGLANHSLGMMNHHPWTIVVLSVALVGAGCSAASRLQSANGKKYRYTYVLQSPSPTGKLSYQDSRIKVLFQVDDGAVRFKLNNLSTEQLTVDWSRASIGTNGRYSSIRNRRTYYSQDSVKVASSVLLPRGYIVDLAVPSENVFYDGEKWTERELLPTTDRNSQTQRQKILANKGTMVDLILPLQFAASGEANYVFRFTVSSVAEFPWDRYRKPWRPPVPKPLKEVHMTSNDQLLTAGIVVGVVGVSVLLLMQKKSPVVE